jgi:hypothetical protein
MKRAWRASSGSLPTPCWLGALIVYQSEPLTRFPGDDGAAAIVV